MVHNKRPMRVISFIQCGSVSISIHIYLCENIVACIESLLHDWRWVIYDQQMNDIVSYSTMKFDDTFLSFSSSLETRFLDVP